MDLDIVSHEDTRIYHRAECMQHRYPKHVRTPPAHCDVTGHDHPQNLDGYGPAIFVASAPEGPQVEAITRDDTPDFSAHIIHDAPVQLPSAGLPAKRSATQAIVLSSGPISSCPTPSSMRYLIVSPSLHARSTDWLTQFGNISSSAPPVSTSIGADAGSMGRAILRSD
jgi:hypothetical protein